MHALAKKDGILAEKQLKMYHLNQGSQTQPHWERQNVPTSSFWIVHCGLILYHRIIKHIFPNSLAGRI